MERRIIKSLTTISVTIMVSIILIVFVNRNYDKNEQVNNSNLPRLKMNFDFVKYDSDGNFAYDIEELINSNPWKINDEIDTLPVFENKISYNDYSVSRVIDLDSIRGRFKEIVIMLKINPDDIINANGIEITEDFLKNKTDKDKKKKIDLLKEDIAPDIIVVDRIIIYPDLSKKIGDYPIISQEEAKKLLIKSKYISFLKNTFQEKNI